ncbi:PREDICTED: protein AF-9-like [Fulmarus glacialis]|uniref:protein AF-9-like n=1 Tax=Fulmarus glacialis TaxID=30455 RepID=UPI00051BE13F|nr:PREDICTED: protein AF-9-like [Fulmarus glacialis]
MAYQPLLQFCVISEFAEGTLCPITKIINEDVKQDWTQYPRGTLLATGLQLDFAPLITTLRPQPFNRFSIHITVCSSSPYINSLSMRTLGETASKTLLKSRSYMNPDNHEILQKQLYYILYHKQSEQPSPASSSSSSSSSFTPSQNSRQQGPLRSIMKDLHSDDNEDESDEADENDNDSDLERPVNTRGGSRSRRVSLSDGSDGDSSSASSPLHHEPAPPLLKTNNNQILEVKSPIKQNKSDKQIKNGDCDKAYLDELVELHRRLMTLRERHVLQQIVNLIEETGHFHITNTTFDFDLCSLDKTTVRKLQSYLETSGTS